MYRQSEKNLLNSNASSACSDNIVNFGLLTAEICWRDRGTPTNFNGFCVLAALYCTASSSGRQPNFAALNRGRHLCSAGRPSGWALAHILVRPTLLPGWVRSIAISGLYVSLSARIAVAWSSSDDSAICYVLPVLWMTSRFHIIGRTWCMARPTVEGCQSAGGNADRGELLRFSSSPLRCLPLTDIPRP